MVTERSPLKFYADNPPFDPKGLCEWAEIRGNRIYVSQNGYSYVSGEFWSREGAENNLALLNIHSDTDLPL